MTGRFSCFVTGTDTGVGKTAVGAGLLAALAATGRRVAGMKPVASGCAQTPDGLRSEDALILMAQSMPGLAYADINPVALRDAVAPRFAAERAQQAIDLEVITSCYGRLRNQADAVIVEGIGGWRVPFLDDTGTSNLVKALSLPVLLVVGLRLGCINHALLTAEAIRSDNARLIGWVANQLDPSYGETPETVNYLSEQIPAPLLGCVPRLAPATAEKVAPHLAVDLLVNP